MNLTLGPGKTVHVMIHGNAGCNGKATGLVKTEAQVTCKRCLAKVRKMDARTDRIAYAADVADTQDMDASQAAPTVSRKVYADKGSVPSWAVLADHTELSRIRGVRQTTVTTAFEDHEDFGLTVWVYAETHGNPARMVYEGDSREAAAEARDAYIREHDRKLAQDARSTAGVRVDNPTPMTRRTY